VWHTVPGVGQASHWRPGGIGDTVAAGSAGLSWSFSTPANTDTMLSVNSYPDPLPVIASNTLVHSGGVNPVGLDANPLPVTVAQAVPAVPGDPVTGVVVDLTYAERAALSGDSAANPQVWVAAGAAADVAKSLKSQGIHIQSTMRASTVASFLQRQGPGLASSLFLLDAAAAALLAALGTVVGLGVSARRRRYEYAALAAGGVSQRELRRSLALEQILVLVTGAVVGVATGIVALIVSARSVPEFVERPIAPALTYLPSPGVLAAVFVVTTALLLVVALVASRVLLRAARPSLLREPAA
jgi:putative ABC transport system permease protein